MEDIKSLANACLNCKKPMCKTGCPISTKIPEFIECIKNNKYKKAYEILQANNIMSQICSKICQTENQCMGSCVRALKGNPVKINKLEEFINSWAKENNIQYELEKEEDKKEKIAIIGGGPAGISCAVELKVKGFDVTILEKEGSLGGVLEYEIPDFRLNKTYVRELEEKIKKIGIKIKTNVEFGIDFNLEDLKNKSYKAVFLAIGAYVQNQYKLTEAKCSDIYTADELLRKYHNKEKINNLGKTIVIGGGNVAMDVARTTNKVGNEAVTVVYRRTNELMPAIKTEQEEAKKEGVKFIYNTKVLEAIHNKDNRLEKIKCIKTKIENDKAVDIPGSEFEMEADSIIFAIGYKIDEKMLNDIRNKYRKWISKNR